MTYNVYTPVIYIPMTAFGEVSNNRRVSSPSTCGYTVTYTVMVQDWYLTRVPLGVPDHLPWIKWNAVNFRYEIQTNDPLDISGTRQWYKLELTASIATTDMNPAFTKTQVVNL